MKTTFLNATIWLLAATAAAGVVGAIRGRDARDVAARIVRRACALPVLTLIVLLSAAGVVSRAAIGFLSPGAYLEEVVAARTFLETGRIYSADGRLTASLSQKDQAQVPWGDIPGITPCQANALSNRSAFYTEQAHPPTLLLSAVPVVAMVGARGLFVVLVSLALAAIGVLWTVLAARADLRPGSRAGLLLLFALAGWQPVLAGVRQGDAVLLAAGLIALAWYMTDRDRLATSVLAALAATLTLPAIALLVALVRRRRPDGILLFSAAVLLTAAIAGSDAMAAYGRAIGETALTYAEGIPNYSLTGRVLLFGGSVGFGAYAAAVLLGSWWCGRSRDAAFGVFAAAGLVLAPIAWSQHLVLAILPAALLLEAIIKNGSSASLAAWAALMLLLSLPDPALIALTRATGVVFGQAIPVMPLAVVGLWIWTAHTTRARAAMVESASATPVQVIS